MSRKFVQRSASLLVMFMLTFGLAGTVLADAGNPILGSINANSVIHPNGTVTVTVRGQWNWLSHDSDCNFDRAATGVGIIWNDPTETGYTVSKGAISAEIGVKTKDGSWADPNPLDAMVHPVDRGNVPEGYTDGTFQSTGAGYPVNAAGDYPLGQLFVDPPLTATGVPGATELALWKGGCGREPLSGAAAGQFAGDPWGSWGYEKAYSHTFRQVSDITSVCVNFYDVHGGGDFDDAKFQVPNKDDEIIVDQNGDNSIETNAFNVNEGANCITVKVAPNLVTEAEGPVSVGDPIFDTATLSGGSNPTGTITFTLYGPDDDTCSGPVIFTSVVTVNGNGEYTSGSFTPTLPGDYNWIATYSGDANHEPTAHGCGVEGETSIVQAGDIKILKTADHLLPVSPGDQIGFTIKVWNAGAGSATGVKLADVLPTDPGLNWSIQAQGAGWAGAPCAIAAGSLTCGGANGVTVPGGTTLGATTYTVHIVSPTTALTGGNCPGTGEVDNTATVSSTNDGSGQSSAEECVQSVDIRVAKVADDQGVVAGQPIGFRIIVWNAGNGIASGVKLSDILPPDLGLNWQIAPSGVGLGWTGAGANCSIVAGPPRSLECGGATGVNVPGALSQQNSLFTVHIVSTTTAQTAAQSPVQNEACVASSNGGAGCANDDVDVFLLTLEKDNNAPDRQIELPDGSTVTLPTQDEGKFVTYTLTYDVGATAVHNAILTDVLPAGVTFQAAPAPTSTNPQLTFVGYTAATRTLTWHADTLSADGSVTYVVKVDAGANKLGQPLINHAAIESEETPEDTAQSEFFVPPPPQISTHVVTGPPTDSINTGQGTTKGSSLLIVLAALGLVVIAVGFITPASLRRRNRR